MLLTSLSLSSSLADLNLVKSQLVVAYQNDGPAARSVGGELARFEDTYGQQFTVIRGSVDTHVAGDRFSDNGYAVCRYNAQGVLDRVVVRYSADAKTGGGIYRTPVTESGVMNGDTFVSEVKNGRQALTDHVSDYPTKAPYFSLLEAVVLYDYRPSSKPLYLLNLHRMMGQPSVLEYKFVSAEAIGAAANQGQRKVLLAVQPQSTPQETWPSAAVDQSGTVYLSSLALLYPDGGVRQSDQADAFLCNGVPVQYQGELNPNVIKRLRDLVPEGWRKPPTD